jgi:peptide/nickel transport system permease protein
MTGIDPTTTSTSFVSSWRIRHKAGIDEARHSVRIFFKDKLAAVSAAYVLFMIVVAVFAPQIAPNPKQGEGAADVATRLQAPTSKHVFGTDELGRDELSRIVYGTRVALMIPALVAIGVLVIGVPLGAIAGYFGGWIDEVIMRITDVILAFPSLVLAMALVAFTGGGLRNVVIALVLTWWPWYTRLVRGTTVSIKQRPYVKAARTMGVRNRTLIWKHILPNVSGPVIVQLTLDIGTVILAAAGLSFVGLGAQPPTADWGLMISDARAYILTQWWLAVFPGLAIFLLVLAFNFIGDGLRDVYDPRTRR